MKLILSTHNLILTKAIDELDARGVTVFNPIKTHLKTNRLLSLQLVSQQQLSKARSFFSLAISLRWILLIATPLVGIAAILIGVERRRTALRVALAGVLACLALAAGLTLGRVYFMGHAGPVTPLVAQHIFDAIGERFSGIGHSATLSAICKVQEREVTAAVNAC